jgi:hypothetical protein
MKFFKSTQYQEEASVKFFKSTQYQEEAMWNSLKVPNTRKRLCEIL